MSRKWLRVSGEEREYINKQEWYDKANQMRKFAIKDSTEVASHFGLSLQRFEQIENLALYKLRKYGNCL
jgi:DNA-directed RNA polymerase sigma subunit (sigma70/sigma32)